MSIKLTAFNLKHKLQPRVKDKIAATPGEMILREDLLKLMPIVNGANRMATELQKGVDYELVLAPPGLKV